MPETPQERSARSPMRVGDCEGRLGAMVELFETRWSPGSKRIRQRLAALGLDFVVRPVPDDPAERDALEEATGVRTVPVLLLGDGSVLDGTDRILGRLGELACAECDSMPSSRGRESRLAGVPMS